MEYSDIVVFAILMFMGGFVDAIAGGGGVLTVPAYMMLGLPIVNVMGTTKFSSSIATISSFIQYMRGYKLKLRLLFCLAPFSLAGSIAGVFLFSSMAVKAAGTMEKIIPFMIIMMGIYTLIDKNLGLKDDYVEPSGTTLIKGMICTFVVGFYDGFFGPGSGLFFVMLLIKVFKIDFLGASGGAKLLNVISGLAALTVFIFKGATVFKFGLIGLFFMWLGTLMGGHIALKKGAKFVKPVFVCISFLVSAKILIQQFL